MSEKLFGEYLQIKSDLMGEAITLQEIADEYLLLFNQINYSNVAASQECLCDISDRLDSAKESIHSLYVKLEKLINKKI